MPEAGNRKLNSTQTMLESLSGNRIEINNTHMKKGVKDIMKESTSYFQMENTALYSTKRVHKQYPKKNTLLPDVVKDHKL